MRIAVCAALVLAACGRRAEPPASDPAPFGARAPSAASQPASAESRGAAAAPGATTGGEESSAATVTDCPRTLSGAESVNRVITRACGTVVVTDDYHLNNGELILEAGATLAFKEGTTLNLGYNDQAKLIVRGTPESPVLFTSAGDQVAGAWKGIRLHKHAERSVIDHLIVEYAGHGGEEAVDIEALYVTFTNSTVRSVKGIGVALGKHASVEAFVGNRFVDVARWPISSSPAAIDGMGGHNFLPEDSVVRVTGGPIDGQAVWRNVGAPFYVSDDIHVAGSPGERALLTIEAGVEVRFGPEAHLRVGYDQSQPGALKTSGTDEAPVRLTSMNEHRPGGWPAVHIYPAGEGSFTGTVFEYGGSPEKSGVGVLHVDGAVALVGCTFRDNLGGIDLRSRARLRLVDATRFERNGKAAIWLHPAQVDGLGSGNQYGPGERIELLGGLVEESAVWRAQTALIELLGDLRVDGRTVLTIESGARFAIKDKIRILVGEKDNASLQLMGTEARPIEFFGIRDEIGSWGGIRLGQSSRDSVLEWVRLRNAGGDGGVFVEPEANARIAELFCARCGSAVLAAACGAKVTATGLHPEDGTARGEVQLGCP